MRRRKTEFLDPASYHWLCDKCRATLAEVTTVFEKNCMADTDDEEAPSVFMYDHAMYCGGRECLVSRANDERRAGRGVPMVVLVEDILDGPAIVAPMGLWEAAMYAQERGWTWIKTGNLYGGYWADYSTPVPSKSYYLVPAQA